GYGGVNALEYGKAQLAAALSGRGIERAVIVLEFGVNEDGHGVSPAQTTANVRTICAAIAGDGRFTGIPIQFLVLSPIVPRSDLLPTLYEKTLLAADALRAACDGTTIFWEGGD